jgi:glutathione synthase
MVVQEAETNTVDQRMLEFQLWESHGIPVVRMSLTKAHTDITLDDTTGALYIAGTNMEVSVVYYRAGYGPPDYPDGYDGIEWQARAKLERSRATKCPSLGYHLAGTKKVQQELARPNVLERFFPTEPDKASLLRTAFAGLYSLGDDATSVDLEAVQQVLNGQQDRFVLKPQREGGGFNFYGDRLLQKILENVASSPSGELTLGKKLGEYILMERLFPPQQRAILLRSGLVEGSGDSISELGCFGTIVVAPDGTVQHNQYAGFLLRTKFSNVDEGGVNAGFATLSSPYLC